MSSQLALKTAANSGPGLALCPSFSPTSRCFPAKAKAVRGLEPLHFFIWLPKSGILDGRVTSLIHLIHGE